MIKIEKHNAHGLNVVIRLSPAEALDLGERLTNMAKTPPRNADNRWYVELLALMEDDNDRWEQCELDFSVETS